MNDFYLLSILLLVLAIIIIGAPWLRKNFSASKQGIINTRLIKQRLTELDQEQAQGLLTPEDKLQAEDELKLALLDEVNAKEESQASAKWPLVLGIVVSVLVGGGSYYHASQLHKVEHWESVKTQTSALGQRILKGDENLTLEDMQDFALGLRSRLIEEPTDPIGWMLLGRVSGALNRVDSSIDAFERSLKYDPNNVGTMVSYANALLMKGQEQQMLHAKKVLLHVVSVEPDNTNAMGMLAVVASELGDKQLALDNWMKLQKFVPQNDPNYAAVSQRIAQLSQELGQSDALTADSDNRATSELSSEQNMGESQNKSVAVTVSISPELSNKLPKNGFLFVFAQDASGNSRIPAAVVKLPLGTFPVEVQLSDKNAMMESFTLSSLSQAKLIARVSADGNVAQSPGELQGEAQVTLRTSEQVQAKILINREW